jgi:hypothetical protein
MAPQGIVQPIELLVRLGRDYHHLEHEHERVAARGSTRRRVAREMARTQAAFDHLLTRWVADESLRARWRQLLHDEGPPPDGPRLATPPMFSAKSSAGADENVDLVLGLNCYLGRDFAGDNIGGWQQRRPSILRASRQLRYAVYLELAREHVRMLGRRLVLIHPVPSFLDRSRWPSFMRLGHAAARRALEHLAAGQGDRRAAG